MKHSLTHRSHKASSPTKRQKQWTKSLLIVIPGLALFAIFVLISYFIFRPTLSPTRTHEIGELVTIPGTYRIAVTKATFDNSIAPKLHLPETDRVLVLTMQIRNTSGHVLNFLPAIHTFVRDDQGNTYSLTPGLASKNMPAALIKKNETLDGSLTYVVPSQYRPLWFYFDAQFDNQGPVRFSIVK